MARLTLANLHRAERRRTRLGRRLAETLRAEVSTHAAPGQAAEVLRAIGELGEDDRELLLLVSWEGLSPAGAALAVAAVIAAAGGSERASRAYGAELIRFAESTPLLLLEGSGWRVQNVYETKTREGTAGQMEFVTGKPIPYASRRSTGNIEEGQRVGLDPPGVRQRKVELRWRSLAEEDLADAIVNRRGFLHGHGRHFTRLPVLGTSAFADTRAEMFLNQGGPGDREMIALWSERGTCSNRRRRSATRPPSKNASAGSPRWTRRPRWKRCRRKS